MKTNRTVVGVDTAKRVCQRRILSASAASAGAPPDRIG